MIDEGSEMLKQHLMRYRTQNSKFFLICLLQFSVAHLKENPFNFLKVKLILKYT